MTRVRALVILLLAALLVRLPFFFIDSVDWDEGTFILIGQSILDGHLPYVHLWDLKPPLLFGFFATAIAAGGHSIVAVRAAGTITVAVTAWLVFCTAVRWWPRRIAGIAAAACVGLETFIGSGQGTMSEHVALPALWGAVALLVATDRPAPGRAFWIGALAAVATLVRLNLAVTGVAIAILLVLDSVRFRRSLGSAVPGFAAGGTAVLALTAMPYVFSGQFDMLWRSVFLAARARTDTGTTLAERAAALGSQALHADGGSAIFWPGVIVGFGALAAAVLAWRRAGAEDGGATRGVRHVTVLFAATAAGIAMSGEAFAHYLIQLVPFVTLLFGALLARLPGTMSIIAAVVLLVSSWPSLQPVVAEYRGLISRMQSGVDLHYGPAYDIAAFLKEQNPGRRPVLVLSDHVAYWLAGTEPPGKFVTHPSTLSRAAVLKVMGTTPQRELETIFAKAPLFVVLDPSDLPMTDEARSWLEATLARNYSRAESIEGRDIYKRIEAP